MCFSIFLPPSQGKSLQYFGPELIKVELSSVKNDHAFWKRSLDFAAITPTTSPVWSYQTPRTEAWGGTRIQLQMGFLSQHLASPSESLEKMQCASSVTSLNMSITSLRGCIRSVQGMDLIRVHWGNIFKWPTLLYASLVIHLLCFISDGTSWLIALIRKICCTFI